METKNDLCLSKATMDDIDQISQLVNHYAQNQLMLPRAFGTLYEGVRDFVVAKLNGAIVGVGALHVIWKDLAEIRSLAVSPEYCHRRIGAQIVQYLLEESASLRISNVFALTYQPDFFRKLGFEIVPKETFPHKVWTDCVNCIKFPNCDEVAVQIRIDL